MSEEEQDLSPAEASHVAGSAVRSKVQGEIDRGDWRRLAERACLSLLNKGAIDATLDDYQKKYNEAMGRIDHLERLVGTFQAELLNQRNTMVKSLHVKYGNGPTAGR